MKTKKPAKGKAAKKKPKSVKITAEDSKRMKKLYRGATPDDFREEALALFEKMKRYNVFLLRIERTGGNRVRVTIEL